MMRMDLGRPGRRMTLSLALLVALGANSACSNGSSSGTDLVALRAALASNPDVEVIATDEKAGVFTVRVKSTGQITTVAAADLAAGKSISFTTQGGTATATAGPGGTAGVTAPGVDIRASGSASGAPANVAITGSGGRGVDVTAGGGAASVAATGTRGSADVSARPGQAEVTARGAQPAGEARPRSGAGAAAAPGGLTVTADGQTVTLGGTRSGGVAVTANGERVAVDPARGGVTVSANGDRVTATSGNTRAQQRPAAGAAAEVEDTRPRRSQPYQCGGGQSLRIENEFIETSGTAVSVEGGCNVVIRNAHIVTNGIGVLAAGASDVTIQDSIIEARGGAVSIQGTATLTASGSTLRGGVRKMGLGNFVDRGGNTIR